MGKVWVITGPMGSGKSTVARQLAEQGATVLDADAIVGRLLEEDEAIREGLVELFGEAVVGESGEVERDSIASTVFADMAMRRKLEALIHPAVLSEMGRAAAAWRAEAEGLLLLEVVLWLQQPKQPFPVDGVLLVTAGREELLSRVAARDSLHPEQVAARLEAQGDWEGLAGRADRVLQSPFQLKELQKLIAPLYLALLEGD